MSIPDRTVEFCNRFGMRVPILLAPMAGASAPALSIAVANAGGLGACGALLMAPAEIVQWANDVRAATSSGAFQINLWIPDPAPVRNGAYEEHVRNFLAGWGPAVAVDAGDATPPDFAAQCETLLQARPPIVSSVMCLFADSFVTRLKSHGMAWFANVSTVAEAKVAEGAGADAVVVQGMEAGGHRGCFDSEKAEREMVGLMSLVPAVADAVRIPVVATDGISDGRGVAAALALGASAAQIGTGFLRAPEAGIHPAWAEALSRASPEDTVVSRAFSGRAGRSLATQYVRASLSSDAPRPAPYPVQRGLTAAMRGAAMKMGDVNRMQVWAGQSARLARAEPAEMIVAGLWEDARALLR
jgi:nitronate monooxygenase